jgi:hypothetical protein
MKTYENDRWTGDFIFARRVRPSTHSSRTILAAGREGVKSGARDVRQCAAHGGGEMGSGVETVVSFGV